MSSLLKKYDLSARDSIQIPGSPCTSQRNIKLDQSQKQQNNQHQKHDSEPSSYPKSRILDHITIAAILFESTSCLVNGILFDSLEKFVSGIIGFFTLLLVCVHYFFSRKKSELRKKRLKLLAAFFMLTTWATSLFNIRGDQDLNIFLLIPILAFKALLFVHYSVSLIFVALFLAAVTACGVILNIIIYQSKSPFEYADGILFLMLTIPFVLKLKKPKKKQEKSVPPPPPEPQFDEKHFNMLHILEEAIVIVNMLGNPVYSNPAFEKLFTLKKEEDTLASQTNRESTHRYTLSGEFQKINGLKAKEPELHNKIADALRTDMTTTPRPSDSLVRRVLRSSDTPDSLLVLDKESGLSNLYVTFLNSEKILKASDIAFNSQERMPKFESFTGVMKKSLKDSIDIEMNLSYLEFGSKNYMCLVFHTNQHQSELKAAQKESDFRKQMLRYVAHDMRNPLGSNQLLLEAAESDPQMSSQLKEAYIRPCLKSLKFLFALVNDLVDAAQLAAGKFKLVIAEVYLGDVIDEVIKIFEIKSRAKDITLSKVLDPRLPLTIFTDGARLTQVLINLLSNALKYTPRKGAITIKVDPNILNVNKIDFSVEDTGIGIRMEDQKDLLKDFGKVDGSKDPELNPYGVGLGLSISNKLAAQLTVEGSQDGIKIDSVVGKGTKMKFSVENRKSEGLSRTPSVGMLGGTPANRENLKINLSASNHNINLNASHQNIINLNNSNIKVSENYSSSLEENAVSSSYEIRRLPSRMKSQPKVKQTLSFLRKIHEDDLMSKKQEKGKAFIIDDDAFSAESLALLLRSLGVAVDKAYSTKDALKKLVTPPSAGSGIQFGYDVIFVDGMMDEMDGFESSKVLKQKMKDGEIKDAPIVFCTGLDAETEAQAREAGASFYATKPINKELLTGILKNLKLGIFSG